MVSTVHGPLSPLTPPHSGPLESNPNAAVRPFEYDVRTSMEKQICPVSGICAGRAHRQSIRPYHELTDSTRW